MTIKKIIVITLILGLILPWGNAFANPGVSDVQTDPSLKPGLSVIQSDSSGIVINLNTPSFQIKTINQGSQNYLQPEITGGVYTDEAGKPELPKITAIIGIPADVDYSLNIINDDEAPLVGRFKLPPSPLHEISQDNAAIIDTLVYNEDSNIYNNTNLYPAVASAIGEEAWLRDQRILRIEFYPFQYIPLRGQLVWHRQMQIQIAFKPRMNQAQQFVPSPVDERSPFEDILRGQLINYESAKSWRVVPSNFTNSSTTADWPTDFCRARSASLRIVVDKDGIYRITRSAVQTALQSSGININSINPQTLALTNQGRKVAISLENNTSDNWSILFFGQKFDGDYLAQRYSHEADSWETYATQDTKGSTIFWKPEFNHIMMEKYTDDNVYWLTWNDTPAWMSSIDGTPVISSTTPLTYTTTERAEQSHYRLPGVFSSEDNWYWEDILNTSTSNLTRTYTSTLSAVASGDFSATVRGEIQAPPKDTTNYSQFYTHTVQVYLNDITTPITSTGTSWKGNSRLHFEQNIEQSKLLNGTNSLLVKVQNYKDQLYFDWYEIQYTRNFSTTENNLLDFSKNESGSSPLYKIASFSDSTIHILDITDPLTPTMIISSTLNSGEVDFEGVGRAGAGRYIIAGDSQVRTPKVMSYYISPAIFNSTIQADYIYISTPQFVTATQQTLATYRTSKGLATRVVNTDDIYNSCNEGIFHPIAVKNFLAYVYQNWHTPKPNYVTFVGDGHWNFKNYVLITPTTTGSVTIDSTKYPNYMPPNLEWVDTELGEVDSPSQLATVVGNDLLPEFIISRIPVNDPVELGYIRDKIASYESTRMQDWQKNITFLADNLGDGSAGNFKQYSQNLVNDYIKPHYGLHATEIYKLDTTHDQNGQLAKDVLLDSLNITGTLIMNYIGHGGYGFWGDHTLELADIPANLYNDGLLPVVLSMDCRDGSWYLAPQPGRSALAEVLLRNQNDGAIATFSPTGDGLASGHDIINRGIFDAVFKQNVRNLGAATESGLLRLWNTYGKYGLYDDLLHTFVIFGDPALTIGGPPINNFLPMTLRSP